MISGLLIEDGEFGRRAVATSTWSQELTTYVLDHGILELELNNGKGWQGGDVLFLANMPQLLSLEIIDFKLSSVMPVHMLRDLKRLKIFTYCKTPIDFRRFASLEHCSFEWRAKSNSLFECRSLRDLFINRYKGADAIPFSNLINLESLAILNAPFQTIEGLTGLSRLRSLRLGNLKKLGSLSGVENLTALEELDINTCRGISSVEPIGALLNLKILRLNNVGDILSLKPLDSLNGLEAVSFYESTNILDGDLSPLANQKRLTKIAFRNRHHYSLRREDFWNKFSEGSAT